MTTKYSTKKALISSIVVLALCFSMLVGTTFAWFTDSASSNGNIIKTGKLDVEMYWADGKEDPTTTNAWKNASEGAIFNYDNWEPGYVDVRHVRISNLGTLALKYKVLIVADGTVSNLADVIDVYYADPAVQITNRAALDPAMKLGTLTDVLANIGATGNGTLEAGSEDTITLALVMQESAGNEYMNKSIGTSFSIQVLATQLTYEPDSFGNQYDKDSTYPNISVPEKVPTEDVEESMTLVANGMKVNVPAAVVNNLPEEVKEISIFFDEPVVNNNTISFASVELVDQSGKKIDMSVNTAPIAVTLPTQNTFVAGTTVLVYHDGEFVDEAVVADDGTISYETLHFCEVSVTTVPDDVVAYVGNNLYKTLTEAVAAANGGNVVVLRDVAESFEAIENVTLLTNVVGGVTITNTFAEDEWLSFNNVNLMSGITLIMPNVLVNGAVAGGSTNVIEGVLMAGTETNTTTYYQYNDAKTIVRNGGQIVVSGDTVLRYNYNADSGIFIYGDGDENTVEYSSGLYPGGYIGAYSGIFYVEDAVVNTGGLRLDFKKGSSEEADKYAPILTKIVNSNIDVTSELRFYKDSNMTLVNAQVTAGKVQVREGATPVITMDANSYIKADAVENLTGALVEAVMGEGGIVTFKSLVAKIGNKTYGDFATAINEATNGSTVVLLTNVNADYGIVLAEGVTLDGNGFAITYTVSDDYHLVKMYTNTALKNVTLNNYRVRSESTTAGTITIDNVTVNMDNDLTGIDISRGSGSAVLNKVTCKGIKDATHLDPSTQVQVDYTPYGDVLLGGAWELQATDCQFGSLHGWNTRNGSNVYLNNTTYTVFRMHYWSMRTLYVNGVEIAWAESGAIPVAHDVGGCWSVQPEFK